MADHLLATLTKKKTRRRGPPPGAVVVTHDLAPAEVARLYRAGVKAVVTEVGGRNSHTSIFARSLGIPAVVGLAEFSVHVGNGDPIIVDGYRGEVLIFPDPETLARYQRRQSRRTERSLVLRKERELAAETQDGWRVALLTNIELSDEIPIALAQGAEGIGLYRTEFLYLGRSDLPSEEEHYADAMAVLENCGQRPVTFRTCDLGVDKMPGGAPPNRDVNPALGLRSIRLCLQHPQFFKTQLRGLLRAAGVGQMRIMFPMISGVDEFVEAKALLEQCRSELRAQGHQIPPVPVGAMVEMPSAAITADLLVLEADFVSVGTNDLTQYTLAIDRTNERVNYLFRHSQPAILRLIHTVMEAANKRQVPVTICGEMAADPLMTMVLLGMGARELSMSALAVPLIKRIVRGVTVGAARELAQRVLAHSMAREVEEEILKTMVPLFPEQRFSAGDAEDEDTIV